MKLALQVNKMTTLSFPRGHCGYTLIHVDDPCAFRKERLRSGCRMGLYRNNQKLSSRLFLRQDSNLAAFSRLRELEEQWFVHALAGYAAQGKSGNDSRTLANS